MPTTSPTNHTVPLTFDIHVISDKTKRADFGTAASNVGYPTIEISFGNGPSQRALIDLGSAPSWAGETSTRSSNTLGTSNVAVGARYGDGFGIFGRMARDTVHLTPSLSFTHEFGLASTPSPINSAFTVLFGLARPFPDQVAPTLMQSFARAGHAAILGLQLPRPGSGGHVTFGSAGFEGNVVYTESTHDAQWAVNVRSARVNGHGLIHGNRNALLDSGSPGLAMGKRDATIVNSAIGATGPGCGGDGWCVPCGSSTVLEIGIAGRIFLVRPQDYVGGPVSDRQGMCQCLIEASSGSGFDWVLGAPFLSAVHVVFDYEKGEIGLAAQGDDGEFKRALSSSAARGVQSPPVGLMLVAVMVWCCLFRGRKR